MKKDEEIKKLKQQVEELTNNWKRALADYQNLEKRVAGEKEEFVKFANSSLILKLLNLLDILEKAQAHIKDKGLELALGEFKKILREEGVSEIEVKPQDVFNPNIMECIEVVKMPASVPPLAGLRRGEEGKVAEVILKGYKLKEKLLRPVKVKVYKKEINERDEKLTKERVVMKGDYM